MWKQTASVSAIVLVLFTSGCGTLLSHFFYSTPEDPYAGLYPGTQLDVATFKNPNVSPFSMGAIPEAPPFWNPQFYLVRAAPLIDLPFSMVFDTINLPFDVYYKYHRPSLKNGPP